MLLELHYDSYKLLFSVAANIKKIFLKNKNFHKKYASLDETFV